MTEYEIERAARDARLGPIGGGTDEIMKEILGKTMVGCETQGDVSPAVSPARATAPRMRAPRGATIAALRRYPVKSMAGQQVDEVELRWQGLVGDRRWAFVFEDDRSRFPWVTGRRAAEMILLRTEFADPENADHSEIVVHGPDGQVRPLDDPSLAQELAARTGRPVRLIRSGRGIFDAFPVSLISTGTAGEIADHRRFRPNLLVEAEALRARRAGSGARSSSARATTRRGSASTSATSAA